MISLDDYMHGYQQRYREYLTDEVKANAPEMVRRANLLLSAFYASNPGAATRTVNSGWRPPPVNQKTTNAAAKSLHMTAEAIDFSDADEDLDEWLMTPDGESALADIGLWHEMPSHTPRWCHVQMRPPGSGRRHFIPR